MTDIIITRADEMLDAVRNNAVAAVLSIEHPGAVPGKGRAPRLAENSRADLPQLILNFWDSEEEVTNGPDIEQIKEGLRFIMEHAGKGPVLIHCNAGVARSTAMALGALALLYPDDGEAALINRLMEIRPQAAPNILVLSMVDQLLGREGRLVQAALDHPDIALRRRKAQEARQRWIERHPEDYKKMHPEKFPKP